MTAEALEAWARFMARMASAGRPRDHDPQGRSLAAHSCTRSKIALARSGVLPIYPREGAPAIRVIVDGIKGSRAPLTIKPGLILHGDGNAFRPELDAILRHGAALSIYVRHVIPASNHVSDTGAGTPLSGSSLTRDLVAPVSDIATMTCLTFT